MPDFKNIKILLIDDSDLLVKILEKYFTDYGASFFSARNGGAGYRKALEVHPDIILCDLDMPHLDGMYFLKERRESDKINTIPVIVLSANKDKHLVAETIKQGAIDYIVKPFNLSTITERIYNVLKFDLANEKRLPTSVNTFYDQGVIFVSISGSMQSRNLIPIKYKILELIHLHKAGNIKILFIIENVESGTVDSSSITALLSILTDDDLGLENEDVVIHTNDDEFIINYEQHFLGNSVALKENFDAAIDVLNLSSSSIDKDRHELKEMISSGISGTDLKNRVGENFIKLDCDIDQKEEIFSGKKALLAEDSEFFRVNVAKYLESKGFEMLFAENGKQALDKAIENNPDIILLDLVMPEINGIQFLKLMKKNNLNFPVIILSSLSKSKVIDYIKNFNIKGYLSKPFKFEKLLTKIKEVISPEILI